MIIDFHAHAFADKIAQTAMERLGHAGGALVPTTDGTVRGLERALDELGEESAAVVLPIATKPSQQEVINNWAAQNATDRIVIFGSIHPEAPDALYELERIAALGIRGIKFHPEYQSFYVDDAHMLPIYRKAASLGLITVFHAGADIGFAPPWRSTPERLAKVLPAFDGAPVVAAHFGGYMMWEAVLSRLCGLPIYFDTAYSHGRIIRSFAERIFEKHGTDRILFGSDLPWGNLRNEVNLIRSLGLSDREQARVLYQNAEKLLGRTRS